MTRAVAAAVLLSLLLVGCEHLPLHEHLLRRPKITPETLEKAVPLGETFCSEYRGSGKITWRCKVYALRDRVLVAFHDVLTGELLAIGVVIGEGPAVDVQWSRERGPAIPRDPKTL